MMQQQSFDVAIVGGGPAGLSAGTWLARYLHSIVLIDSGDPRNWETRGVNGFLGHPSIRPAELRGMGRAELRSFDNVTLCDDSVVSVCRDGEESFTLTCRDSGTIRARRLLLAYGLKDEWPDIEGLDHVYGDAAHVCPDCDGLGALDKKTVVIGKGRRAVGMALNLANWTRKLTVCTNGEEPQMDDYLRGKLEGLDIPVVTEKVKRLEIREGGLRSMIFEDREPLGVEKLFFTIGQQAADDLGAQLGCRRNDTGQIEVDTHYHTSSRNVWAAGDLTRGAQLAIAAAGDGAVAALSIHKSLVPEERKLARR